MRVEKAREKKKDKKRNRLIFRTIILAVLVAAVVFALITNAKKDNTIYRVGDKAPDFELQQINKNNDLETIRLRDRKSTRLNSSHVAISYAVFCLKKKTKSKRNVNKRVIYN